MKWLFYIPILIIVGLIEPISIIIGYLWHFRKPKRRHGHWGQTTTEYDCFETTTGLFEIMRSSLSKGKKKRKKLQSRIAYWEKILKMPGATVMGYRKPGSQNK